ncbi:hypothetical protein Cob_v001263 [Colletotrichum orbiculare MAFF 240422]|uniref:Uncharacterized protein n=1 Tax=Colletotrichum orbiculare (strain 104-T / ATCC 96160 / CBS 514.97 / LARS 414 / MAFF 240422) TaxID=1213857 RepID=A0A484G535_COLOR|nr:hypothetical protein Cob_v001263 [Colletotrichum orbiculare MAFF 240422]
MVPSVAFKPAKPKCALGQTGQPSKACTARVNRPNTDTPSSSVEGETVFRWPTSLEGKKEAAIGNQGLWLPSQRQVVWFRIVSYRIVKQDGRKAWSDKYLPGACLGSLLIHCPAFTP